MKKLLLPSIAAVLGGFAFGHLVTRPTISEPPATPGMAPGKSKVAPREWSTTQLAPSTRMQAMADRAAKLSPAEWPAFFRGRLDSPEESRLAARLWAESDPAGFWNWLKGERDLFLLERFGPNLMKTWALTDPDAAMDAAWQVTHKIPGDKLRRAVVDSTLDHDLEKGLALLARAGDLDSSGYKPSEWMEKDPATAVTGLAALPTSNRYGVNLLDEALSIWIRKDAGAALEWLKTDQARGIGLWTRPSPEMIEPFRKAAAIDGKAALEVALSYPDPEQRNEALAGVLGGWRGDLAEAMDALAHLPLGSRVSLAADAVVSRPATTKADLEQIATLLEGVPANRWTVEKSETLARNWRRIDRDAGLQWAEGLADPVSRKHALKVLQPALTPEEMPPVDVDPFAVPSE